MKPISIQFREAQWKSCGKIREMQKTIDWAIKERSGKHDLLTLVCI